MTLRLLSRAVVRCAAVAVAVVLAAPEALAQVPPTPVVPPPVLDTIVDDFRTAVQAARPALLGIAAGTFGVLAVIEIALSAIVWTLRESGPERILSALVLKLAWLAFAFGLIASFGVWFPPVIDGFHQAGQAVAPGVVSPGDVLGLGVQLSTSMVNGFFDGVGLMDLSFNLVATAILVALSALVVEIMYAVIAAAVLVGWTGSGWPGLAVAGVIALVFLHSAWEIMTDAKRDLRTAGS